MSFFNIFFFYLILSFLIVKQREKGKVSVKVLQEVFNRKCSDLVGKAGQKMPYVRAGQMGIVFKDFPNTLEKEFGIDPRKPHLYGSAQRRKFALSRSIFS
ncbi:hypothetical protein ACROYT_G021163, partial [Oculina patagonica]